MTKISDLSDISKQTLALLAVDNIHPSKAGLELFKAVDRGDMTIDEAREAVKARARDYAANPQTVIAAVDAKV